MVVTQGEIIRFDQVKGYGFIAPKNGGEDVFLHANDLLDDKHLMCPGAIVEFVMENGERGLKASSVHLVSPAPAVAGPSRPVAAPRASDGRPADARPADVRASDARPVETDDDDLVDVLPEAEYVREVTEVLLQVTPGLTGPQVLAARQALAVLGRKYGWIGG